MNDEKHNNYLKNQIVYSYRLHYIEDPSVHIGTILLLSRSVCNENRGSQLPVSQ